MLVRPLGFSTSNRMLKRAGLDYWEEVDVSFTDDLFDYLKSCPHPFYFFSRWGKEAYTSIKYGPCDHLVFGSEVSGLPQQFHETWPDRVYRIPMKEDVRCLNLANAASIVLYEAYRQLDFNFYGSS
jgi:tRNA (cytidine/uridine-2'-O-)-methyltransferase